MLSAEEIEALLGALSEGEVSDELRSSDLRGSVQNFNRGIGNQRDPLKETQEILNSALDADSRIKMLEKEKINIDRQIKKIKSDYPNCPECGCRYRFGSYLLSLVDEEYNDWELIGEEKIDKGKKIRKIIYAECPRGHKIRLGKNLFGIKKDEILSQEQIDKLVAVLNEADYAD